VQPLDLASERRGRASVGRVEQGVLGVLGHAALLPGDLNGNGTLAVFAETIGLSIPMPATFVGKKTCDRDARS